MNHVFVLGIQNVSAATLQNLCVPWEEYVLVENGCNFLTVNWVLFLSIVGQNLCWGGIWQGLLEV